DKEWSRLVQANAPDYFRYLQQPFLGIMLSRVLSLGIVYALVINTLIPLFIRIMIAYNREQLQTMELARQNVQLEFNFLKSQVNPHFLHNTLNNIYSLIIHDKKTEAAGTVARLSAFMRYSMNDAGTENMPAAREVQLMQDYIELERIRLNYATVQAQFEMDDTVYTLPPLLLIPVIENAFKYSTDQKDAVISINFVINKKRLSFDCQNNFDPDVTTHLQHGIGIANVKKRLDQYYAQGYSYTETTVNNVYSVNISIDLL
ncbi:MAG: histidine kinase, partial [Chitinophagaceae bacterium]